MNPDNKFVVGASNATTITTLTALFDMKGFEHGQFFFISTSTGTAITGTSCKIEHSDVDTSGFAEITGYVQGTDWTGSTDTNATSLAKIAFNVNRPSSGCKRYIKVTASHATGGIGTWLAVLSKGAVGTNTLARQGAANGIGF